MNCSKYFMSRFLYHHTSTTSLSPSSVRFGSRRFVRLHQHYSIRTIYYNNCHHSLSLDVLYHQLNNKPFSTLQSQSFSNTTKELQKIRRFSTDKTIVYASPSEQSKASNDDKLKKTDNNTIQDRVDHDDDARTSDETDIQGMDGEDDEQVTLRLTSEEIQELTGGSDELERKIKLIQMEHELAKQDGVRVPFKPIKLKKWKELLDLSSRHQRLKYFKYLWNVQMAVENDAIKKKLLREQKIAEFQAKGTTLPTREEDPHGTFYKLGGNSIFLRLYDTSINFFYHSRVISSMIHGQPLVIDCGYDEHMTQREAKNCAAQIEFFLTDNRTHPKEPMNVYLCNVDKSSKLMNILHARIPTLFNDNYALNVTEASYLELFPKDKLIYMSPHAREELTKWNDDDIYIIGAMVDKTDPRPFSLAKAKREGLRIKKLPLDQYVEWSGGSGKSLTVNQMGNIMLDFYHSRDWNSALKFVPTRKLKRPDELVNPSDRFYQYQPKPDRREKSSSVLKDFELMSNRRSFGFKSSRGDTNYNVTGGRNEARRSSSKLNIKSILHDE